MNGIITDTINIYIHTFNGYFAQFLEWGKEFFFTSLVITIVWLCLWNAFDKNSFSESMPKFIKEFFIISFFYTVMIYANKWLITIPDSASFMGKVLSGFKVDPSSIIDQGIKITNFLSNNINPSGILERIYTAIIVAIANILILFAFISIALDLAVTTLSIYFFIAISGFALSFSVFSFTRSIARKTLDVVVANSVKLLSLYLIIAAGNGVFIAIADDFKGSTNTLDILGWVMAAAFLFWLANKNIPTQVARVFSDVIQETRGTDAAALTLAAINNAKTGLNLTKTALRTTGNVAKTTHDAIAKAQNFFDSKFQPKTTSENNAKTTTSEHGSLTDHAKQIISKTNGDTAANPTKSVPNASTLQKANDGAKQSANLSTPSNIKNSSAGAPSSAGRASAGTSSTRSELRGNISKPRKK